MKKITSLVDYVETIENAAVPAPITKIHRNSYYFTHWTVRTRFDEGAVLLSLFPNATQYFEVDVEKGVFVQNRLSHSETDYLFPALRLDFLIQNELWEGKIKEYLDKKEIEF